MQGACPRFFRWPCHAIAGDKSPGEKRRPVAALQNPRGSRRFGSIAAQRPSDGPGEAGRLAWGRNAGHSARGRPSMSRREAGQPLRIGLKTPCQPATSAVRKAPSEVGFVVPLAVGKVALWSSRRLPPGASSTSAGAVVLGGSPPGPPPPVARRHLRAPRASAGRVPAGAASRRAAPMGCARPPSPRPSSAGSRRVD